MTRNGRGVIEWVRLKGDDRIDGKGVAHGNDDTFSGEDVAVLVAHRFAVRAKNLLGQLLIEERRRLTTILSACVEIAIQQPMFGGTVHASE